MSGVTHNGIMFGALVPPLAQPIKGMVRTFLERSTARDPDEDVDVVLREVDTGASVAWVASEGADMIAICITQTLVTSNGNQCFIRHCAGHDRERWIGFLEVIAAWAQSQGCTTMVLMGRPGWERALPGWNRQAVVLRREL